MMNQETHVVFFDEVCLFCNRSVRWLLKHDARRCFSFAPLQGKLSQGLGLDSRNLDSVVLVTHLDDDRQELFFGAAAVIKIASMLSFPWNWARVFFLLPASWTEWAYQRLATRRYRWFGKSETACPLPTTDDRKRFLE